MHPLLVTLALIAGPTFVLVGVWEYFYPTKPQVTMPTTTPRSLVKSVLRTAYRAIQTGWCAPVRVPGKTFVAGALARTASGETCAVNDPAACQWSLIGALQLGELHVAQEHGAGPSWDAFTEACELIQSGVGGEWSRNLLRWNDSPSRTQAQVLSLLERAGREV